MKNAGVGVGLPDTGRVRLVVQGGKVHIHAGASCIGQGLGTVLVQIVCETTGLPREAVAYEPPNTSNSPDSGTTSGSRQTLITGEAARRACSTQRLRKSRFPHSKGRNITRNISPKPIRSAPPSPIRSAMWPMATPHR